MSTWLALDPLFHPMGLGFLPDILLESDKRPVKEQLEERYAHGGGYRPLTGLRFDPKTMVMRFPGDPPYKPAACAQFGTETVIFYPQASLLAIVQKDGTFEVTRVD